MVAAYHSKFGHNIRCFFGGVDLGRSLKKEYLDRFTVVKLFICHKKVLQVNINIWPSNDL